MMNTVLLTAAVLGLLLFLIQPGKLSPAQEAPFRGRYYAHRGLYTKDRSAPENSLPAFEAAAAGGYGIELDVQLSQDGRVMVFHDDDLERVTGYRGRVDSLPLEKLRQLRLCGSGETLPLFEEVLALVKGRVPLIVELKPGPRGRELCEKTLALLRSYEGAYCVESFDPFLVGWFKKQAPDILRGLLADSCARMPHRIMSFFPGRGLTNFIARPQFIAWGQGKKNLLMRLAEAFGPMKIYWTAKGPEKTGELEAEYDGIIFEQYAPHRKY